MKWLPQTKQCVTSESGCHRGNAKSLSLLVVLGCDDSDGRGADGAAGEEVSTTGLLLDPEWFSECILMLDGRLNGESAVVNLLFRSDELGEGWAARCEEERAGNE